MRYSAKEISLAAMFAALAAVAAMVFRFGAPVVPFSLVPFVVLLAGMLLGPRMGAFSMTVYVFMGLLGIPVFEKPPFGGPAYVLQPTFGFLLGFILAAYITGKILPQQGNSAFARYVLAFSGGIAAYYLVGLPYLYIILNFYMGKAVPVLAVIKMAFIPFIGFDLLKGVLASFLAMAVVKRVKAASRIN